MKLSFQNFYAFEFTLGFLAVTSGFYLLQFSLFFALLILGGCIFVFDSVTRWDKSQRNKESIEKLELDRINTELDFDIKEVTAEKDIDWYPDDVVNGQPVGFNEVYTTTYKIELIVYNSCVIENVIRNIEVEIPNQKKKANIKITSIEDINRIPISIAPRTHKKLVFHAGVNEMNGKKGDILKITLTSMDNKKTHKEYEIKYYNTGSNLRDIVPEN